MFLERGRNTYSEVTPSGTGCRVWGLASGEKLHRKFDLVINDKPIAAELFRRTNKALTITGLKLDSIREFSSIDSVLDWAVIWGERRKAAAAKPSLSASTLMAAATRTPSTRSRRSSAPAPRAAPTAATPFT